MKKWVLLSLFVVVLGLAVTFFVFKETSTVKFNNGGVEFSYSEQLILPGVSPDDKDSGVIFRATNREGMYPILISVRTEKGFDQLSSQLRQSSLEILDKSISKNYPIRFTGFKEVSRNRVLIDGKESLDLTFEYLNEGESLKQRFIAVKKSTDEFIYFSLQSRSSSYVAANSEHFDSIVRSIDL